MGVITKLPLLAILVGISALAMIVPAAHAVRLGDFATARVFFQIATFVLLITTMTAVATWHRKPANSAHSHLFHLFSGFVLLPVILALPLAHLMPDITFLDAYFEMLSSLTTTGATIFDDPARLSDPLHLWRALVGWIGGLLMWVAAIAIMSPLRLGGFEIFESDRVQSDRAGVPGQIKVAGAAARVIKFTLILAPIYLVITLALTLGLVVVGERFFIAVIHAMSTIATSGISPVTALDQGSGGFPAELLIFVFFIFAVTRMTISSGTPKTIAANILRDHEFRLMVVLVTTIPLLLLMRHLLGAFTVNEHSNVLAGIRALWGSAFTVLSFLTTTGFASADWGAAQGWSGLKTPGMILMGLATMGGGIATTAGGIKLLRVYALYKHGLRELQKLSYPDSVGGAGKDARRIRREGAFFAWIFFMLFALSAALVMLALSLTGLNFESSLIMTIAALSTTGPLVSVASEGASTFATVSDAAKMVLCAAMVLGRFETLAVIALLNPDFWRR